MNPFGWFSRPAWQARDASRRADAVANGRDAMLIAALPLILRQDADAGVRRAALERIDDLTLVADRMTNDTDSSVRDRARARFADLLTGKAPLAERQRALKLIDDQPQLEAIARRSTEVAMRRAALERCTRPGFLIERCLEDGDAEIKSWLLSRIDARASLERIAAQARTRDKRLYRLVRERLDGEKLAAGEGDALLARAEALCVTIETRLRHPGSDALDTVATVEAEWAAIRPRIDERFDRRFSGAVETIRDAMGAIARIGEPTAVVDETAAALAVSNAGDEPAVLPVEIVPAAPARTEVDSALQELLQLAQSGGGGARSRTELERRWNTTWAADSARPEADEALAGEFAQIVAQWRESDAQLAASNAAHRAAADLELAAFSEAIEAGQLMAARLARSKVRAAADAMRGDAARLLRRDLADLEPKLEKLAQWQRWSDDKLRARLLEEVEELAGKGLHPDALANRIAELKQAWQKIDESEHDPSAPMVESGLTRRFKFLCHQTLQPAKPFFEKRREIRGKRAEELGEFMQRALAEQDSPETPISALIALKREAAERLRRVDEIDPRLRGENGRQLKQLMESASSRIDSRFAAIAEEKQKLIAQLRRQTTHAELGASLELAKAAQRKWQSLPKGTQKSDQLLWQELRDLIDPLFAQRVAAGNAASAERDAERASAQALVDELTAVIADENLDAIHLEAEIARCELAWRSQENRPFDLERAFEAAQNKARLSVEARRDAQLKTRADQLIELSKAIDALEARAVAGADVADELNQAATTAGGFDASVAGVFQGRIERLRALDAQTPAAAFDAQAAAARLTVLEYEFLAGVESPASDSQTRLNLQVEKLSARLSSGQSSTPAEQRRSLDLRWWAIGPLRTDDRQAFSARRDAALAALSVEA